MFLKWQPIYSVNVKELDEQHQKIFEIINSIFELKNGQSQKNISELIKELKDYGSYHLTTEENYFKKFNYPDQKFHINQHDNYRQQIINFEQNINNHPNDTLIDKLAEFSKNWWLNHIQNTDQQYSAFFNENGLI